MKLGDIQEKRTHNVAHDCQILFQQETVENHD